MSWKGSIGYSDINVKLVGPTGCDQSPILWWRLKFILQLKFILGEYELSLKNGKATVKVAVKVNVHPSHSTFTANELSI